MSQPTQLEINEKIAEAKRLTHLEHEYNLQRRAFYDKIQDPNAPFVYHDIPSQSKELHEISSFFREHASRFNRENPIGLTYKTQVMDGMSCNIVLGFDEDGVYFPSLDSEYVGIALDENDRISHEEFFHYFGFDLRPGLFTKEELNASAPTASELNMLPHHLATHFNWLHPEAQIAVLATLRHISKEH